MNTRINTRMNTRMTRNKDNLAGATWLWAIVVVLAIGACPAILLGSVIIIEI